MPSRSKPKDSYHHGDLRRALLDAGVQVLRKDGIEALSLREVARRAGVSHAAPYRHFPSKEALLAAIAEQGFVELTRSMEEACTGARGALDRLNRTGKGYVRFAVRHPDHLLLMFRQGLFAADYPPLLEAAQKAFAFLVDAVKAAQAAGQLREGDPVSIAWTQWSLVHGLAVLLNQGGLRHVGLGPEDAETAARTALSLLQSGLER